MGAIDAVTSHWGGLENKIITVPEWVDPDTGKALEIHVKPPTLKEKQALLTKTEGVGLLEGLAETLCLVALNATGGKMFDADDKMKMIRGGHPDIIGRVAAEAVNAFHIPDPGGVLRENPMLMSAVRLAANRGISIAEALETSLPEAALFEAYYALVPGDRPEDAGGEA